MDTSSVVSWHWTFCLLEKPVFRFPASQDPSPATPSGLQARDSLRGEVAVPRVLAWVKGLVLPPLISRSGPQMPSVGCPLPRLPFHLQELGWIFLYDASGVLNRVLKFRNLLFAAIECNSNPGLAPITYFAFEKQTKPTNISKNDLSHPHVYTFLPRGLEAPLWSASVPPKGAGLPCHRG